MAMKMPATWMQLGNGRYVDPMKVGYHDVDVVTIAWSLARMIRFGGHGKHAPGAETTVADHCLTLADMLRERGEGALVQLQGLMHDCGETFVVDVPRGIKCRDEMQFFRDAEEAARRTVCSVLGIPPPTRLRAPIIKEMDLVSCIAEARLIMADRGEGFQSATQERLALADEALASGLCWRLVPKRESMTIALDFLGAYDELRKEAGL